MGARKAAGHDSPRRATPLPHVCNHHQTDRCRWNQCGVPALSGWVSPAPGKALAQFRKPSPESAIDPWALGLLRTPEPARWRNRIALAHRWTLRNAFGEPGELRIHRGHTSILNFETGSRVSKEKNAIFMLHHRDLRWLAISLSWLSRLRLRRLLMEYGACLEFRFGATQVGESRVVKWIWRHWFRCTLFPLLTKQARRGPEQRFVSDCS